MISVRDQSHTYLCLKRYSTHVKMRI